MFFPSLYIDPTAGGIGIQILLGAVVGGFVTVKLMWSRLFSLFRRSRRQEEATAASEAPTESVEDNP